MVDFAALLNKPPRPPSIVPNLVLGVTGHRPHKLDSLGREPEAVGFDGYKRDNPLRVLAREELRQHVRELRAKWSAPPTGRVTPDVIEALGERDVFVFGSNKLGISKAGAALTASDKFGAQQGVGEGPTGRCYALPTKRTPSERATVEELAWACNRFAKHAAKQGEDRFLVTEVGCRLAGFTPRQVAPLLFEAARLPNVLLPASFWPFLLREVRGSGADWVESRLCAVKWKCAQAPTEPVGVTGMALGFDTDAAEVFIGERLPFVAAIPFPGQEDRWPRTSQDYYRELVRDWAVGVHMVSAAKPVGDSQARELLLKRDDWVVEVCDEMVALYDGSGGGTAHTVRKWDRFHIAGSPIRRIDARELRERLRGEA